MTIMHAGRGRVMHAGRGRVMHWIRPCITSTMHIHTCMSRTSHAARTSHACRPRTSHALDQTMHDERYAYTSRTSHVSVQTMHDVRQPAIYSSIEALKPLPQYSTAGFKTSLWCALIEFSQQEEVSERNHAWACIRLGACVLN